jgi:hypothetical protein
MTKLDHAYGSDEQWTRFLAALEADCTECGGAGKVRSGRWQAWYERASELIRVAQVAHRAADLSHAEVQVPTVVVAIERAIDQHMQGRPDEPENLSCAACRGTGRVLTGLGLRLSEFLSRHGFVRGNGP